jgi:type III pantothenate kinase
MVLVVDIGNTRSKAAAFENQDKKHQFVCLQADLKNEIQATLHTFTAIKTLVLASVAHIEPDFLLGFDKKVSIHFISHESIFPFTNHYKTPKTLGIDRMVLAAGATLQFPQQNRLVIDVGTCITYDFITAKNEYLGGAISPGLQLRYQALHQFTAKLPFLDLEEPADLIGNSTSEAIHSGVVHGVTHEIEGFITAYKARYENFIIILTGGDTNFLAKRLKNGIFANSNFLLESLNQTFQYQIKND